jgi:hypothetical protein
VALTLVHLVAGFMLANAQAAEADRVDYLQRRIDDVASVLQTQTLQLERRMTRLETISEANRTLLQTIAGAVALQVLSTIVGWFRALRISGVIARKNGGG